jgi:hypothetical protein
MTLVRLTDALHDLFGSWRQVPPRRLMGRVLSTRDDDAEGNDRRARPKVRAGTDRAHRYQVDRLPVLDHK